MMHKRNQKKVPVTETCFTSSETNHPSQTVEISVDIIPEFVETTVSYLKTLEVQIVYTDVDTLTRVTRLQVQAKVTKARLLVGFGATSDEMENARRVARHFSEGLKSSAVLIDQIGLVERTNQKFAPTLKLPGQPVNVLADEMDIVNYPDLVEKYVHLIMRIVNKKPHAIVPINFKDGLGEMTQFVGSHNKGGGWFEAWCAKEVPIQVLIMGAGLRFGFKLQDNWRDRSIEHVTAHVDVAGFLIKLMRVNDETCSMPRRQGLGAKPRQAKNFRAKKNQKIYEQEKEGLRELRDYYCEYDNLEDLLSSLSTGIFAKHPTKTIEIKADIIPKLVKDTVSYLEYEGVKILETDVDTLTQVTKLQVQAKVVCAHLKAVVKTSLQDEKAWRAVRRHFSRGLKSSAVLIDQIGVVEHTKEMFVPKLKLPVESQVDKMERTTPTNYTDLINNYDGLLRRIADKKYNAIGPINLGDGSGQMTQLVGSRDVGDGCFRAWCAKEVPCSVLSMGAGFQFGLNLKDNWRDQKIENVNITVNCANFFHKLMIDNDKPMSLGGDGNTQSRIDEIYDDDDYDCYEEDDYNSLQNNMFNFSFGLT